MRIARLLVGVALLGLSGGALARERGGAPRLSASAPALRDASAAGLGGSAAAGWAAPGGAASGAAILPGPLAPSAALALRPALELGDDARGPDSARAGGPVRDGMSMSLDVLRRDASRKGLLHVLRGRF